MKSIIRDRICILRRFQQRRSCSIAENHASGAIGVIDDRRHHIRSNHQHPSVNPGANELCAYLHRIKKGRTGSGEIESPRSLCTQLVLHHAGRRGEKHVRSDRADDDRVKVGSIYAALRQCLRGGCYREIARGNALVHDVALANADPCHDPIVIGIDHLFQIGIGEQAEGERA